MIAFLFGGRAAEELIFEDYTTGAGNDIERATDLARKMVCEWGMSEAIGPLRFEGRDEPVFLGLNYNNSPRDVSNKTAETIDEEVRRLVTTGYDLAVKILKENLDVLHGVAKALLDKETIDGEEVMMLLEGATLEDIERERGLRRQELEKQNEEMKAKVEEKEKQELEEKEKKEKDSEEKLGDPDPVTA
jgi:cell division protease FtsH